MDLTNQGQFQMTSPSFYLNSKIFNFGEMVSLCWNGVRYIYINGLGQKGSWVTSVFYKLLDKLSLNKPKLTFYINRWVQKLAKLILSSHPANERCRYKVTPSLIGRAQT